MLESKLEDVAVASDMQMAQVVQSIDAVYTVSHLPSYRPYRWVFANDLLDIVDRVTGGRAGVFQRFCTYVVIGGFAAVVNLVVFFLVLHISLLPDDAMRNVIASICAGEISIMANFVPNDYFTFKHLDGHNRTWAARCTRFHVTSIGGSLLTFLIQFGFSSIGHILAIASQAIALVIVLLYNFTFHHLFTYRRVKTNAAH
jgi:putative flippase GtrA